MLFKLDSQKSFQADRLCHFVQKNIMLCSTIIAIFFKQSFSCDFAVTGRSSLVGRRGNGPMFVVYCRSQMAYTGGGHAGRTSHRFPSSGNKASIKTRRREK